MTKLNEDAVRVTLRRVNYPGFSRDIISFGLVKDIRTEDGRVHVHLSLATRDPAVPQALKESVEAAVSSLQGVREVAVRIDIQDPPAVPPAGGTAQPHATQIEGVRHVVAIASGKGGVGKSTVAANLACALTQRGLRVGLCDCDLYGPSMGLMFGIKERPLATEEGRIIPIEREGLRLMSMGFLLDDDSPAVLRGPMVTRYTQQFLRHVEWGELDVLVLDLPPGTGDIQLTIVQTVALAGAVLVTTPQEVALIDARKAASMFEKVNVPVLGIVENMSYFLCPSDGASYAIFGEGGGEREARRLKVPLLGRVPIEMATREAGDLGQPVVLRMPQSHSAKEFTRIASSLHESLSDV